MSYDVVVVGAGPVGSSTARLCAEKGLSTLCIEEHGTIGYPVQCAGLLSNNAFHECEVSSKCVLNTVSGARVVSDGGGELLFDAGSTKAYVVDRGILDREMAEQAGSAGAEFRPKTGAFGVRGGNVLLTKGAAGHDEVPFKILIAADGPRSIFTRLYGMGRAKVFLAGIQADVSLECDPCYVGLYPDASPDFFGWLIPIGSGRARIGLCGQSHVQERFNEFLKRMGCSSVIQLVTGTLPLGVMPRTYGRRTLFTGDAAGFAKPTSGGGIYTGIRTARHAADVAVSCFNTDRFDDNALSEYERRWQADIGRELALGFRLFLARRKMAKEDIDGLVRALNDPTLLRLIVKHGDMDRPCTLTRMLLLRPDLLRWTMPLFSAAIRSLF